MSLGVKRVLVILVLLVTVFGCFVSLYGLGDLKNVKDEIKYGLDINGGVYAVLEAQTDDLGLSDEELKELMEQTREVINNRVNQLGVSEATVAVEGKNRIRVELPGYDDPNKAIESIGTTAKLLFVLCDGSVALDGSYVKDAQVATDGAAYKILLELDPSGAALFEEATRKAYNKTLTPYDSEAIAADEIAIVLDDVIITHPRVLGVIPGGNCEITGGFSLADATTKAALIRGGALPVDLVEVQSSVQSATIGANALDKSIIAGGIGLLLVFIVMIIFFGLLGVVADIALILYVVLFVWGMAAFNIVLTLPGIAALILSIGMAVDANVIIFDRIKEEIGAGKSIRVAVDAGFKNAVATVLDAQITTLIAAVVLFEIGTTVVKGFAVTLMIGIVLSIFTAVIITQLFISLMASSKKLSNVKLFGCKADGTPKAILHRQLNFIGKRKIFYIISSVIIVAGLVITLCGGLNYGIDFTGGTTIQIEMHEQVDIKEVEKALDSYKLDPTIIYTGEGNTQIQIKTIHALENEERVEIVDTLSKTFKCTQDDVLASEEFGPTVGKELKANAVKSIALASLGMLIYVIIRFKEWKFGLAAVIGVLHDALMVIAFYAIFGYTVNNPFIAAILTLVGYSINDTIVIFDRCREVKRLNPRRDSFTNLNAAINETLNRTTVTSLTTLVVMIPLLVMVSSSISEFIVPLMVGVIVGCYSSICICTPLYYDFNKKKEQSKYLADAKKAQKSAKKSK